MNNLFLKLYIIYHLPLKYNGLPNEKKGRPIQERRQ